jgi:Kef-type K+ transport system membrane component KefB
MATTNVAGQRWAAVAVILVLGIFSLPVAASPFGDDDNENLIIVVAVVFMVVVGLIVGALLPGLAGPGASRARGAMIGALVGVAMLVLGIVVFFLLLSGFDGA